MSFVFLAILAPIVALAADAESTDRLAAADEAGHIFVSEDGGGSWRPVFECALSAETNRLPIEVAEGCATQRPGLAWVDGSLYIACPDEPILRLDDDQLSPHTPSSSVLVARRPTALAGGSDLHFSEANGTLWRLRSDGGLVEWRSDPPTNTVAIAVLGDRVIVSGPRAIYEWRSAQWRSIRESRSCALAAIGDTVWSAGPDGIERIENGAAETVNSSAAIAIAVSSRWLWWSDGQRFERVALTNSDRPPPTTPEVTRWPAVSNRARTSAWLPRVELTVRVGKQWLAGANGSIPALDRQTQVWVVLSWPAF